MRAYLDILMKVLNEGERKPNRTGIDTFSITGEMFKHDMRKGFPLLTTKKMGLKNICTELEFFIQGYQDKKWLQDRDCHIWDNWCNPSIVPYGTDDASRDKMRLEGDLGRIYGVQWRNWRTDKFDSDGNVRVIDQLANLIDTLKKNPFDRRMIVTAWNPAELHTQALPPCHFCFQVVSDGEYVDLLWSQRSVDTPLGLPYDIASYAMLLKLIASTVGMKPRTLVGFLADTHIYENQVGDVTEYIKRQPLILPEVVIPVDTNIFTWKRDDFLLKNYKSHPAFPFKIAV